MEDCWTHDVKRQYVVKSDLLYHFISFLFFTSKLLFMSQISVFTNI